VSQLVRDSHARALRLPPDAFVVINPGLPDMLFEPPSPGTRASVRSELAVREDDLVLMNVARFDPGKGQDVLIDAFIRLADLGNLRLVLVGDGTTRAELHDVVRTQGVDDRVTFLGSRDDVPRLLQGADIFANASTNEGFGIAPLEAMAAGLPVVAVTGSNNAVVEFIDDGATGLLVDDTGPAELAAAIERLTDDGLRSRLGERARVAARRWSASASVGRLERLYGQLVDTSGRIDGGAPRGSP
jgi:glycosyltransferase involved in cell wall biosynthesis